MINEKQLIDANDVYSLFDVNGLASLHITDIDAIPRVDVESVRNGRWIMGTSENGLQTGHRKCSRCGEIVKYGYSLYGVHNFCNYCGAKMDGDDVNG